MIYQIANIKAFNDFINEHINKVTKLDEAQLKNVTQNIKRLISSDDAYMNRSNLKSLGKEYEKQLIVQDTMRIFKPTQRLINLLDFILDKVNREYMDWSKFTNLEQIVSYYKNSENTKTKKLGNVGNYELTKFVTVEAMKHLLKNFTPNAPTEDNTLLLFTSDKESILFLVENSTNSLLDVFNFKKTENVIEIVNLIIENQPLAIHQISNLVTDKANGLMINNALMSIEQFENSKLVEINHDFIVTSRKIMKFPDVLIVRGSLIIKRCNPKLTMQERCSVVKNLVINTEVAALARHMVVGGYVDLRHSTIKLMPRVIYVKKDFIVHLADINGFPQKVAVGGNLSLSGMKIQTTLESMYVGGILDLQSAKLNGMPTVLYVGEDCNIIDSNITYIGPKTRIMGTLYKNRKITISRLAEIQMIDDANE